MNEIYQELPLHLNHTKHHVIQLTGSNRDPIHILMRFDINNSYMELNIANNRWLQWTCISLRIIQAGVHLFWQNSKICHLKGIFVPVYWMICSNSKLKVKRNQIGRYYLSTWQILSICIIYIVWWLSRMPEPLGIGSPCSYTSACYFWECKGSVIGIFTEIMIKTSNYQRYLLHPNANHWQSRPREALWRRADTFVTHAINDDFSSLTDEIN